MASTIVGYFDDFNEARQAEQELISAGFGRDGVALVSQQTEQRTAERRPSEDRTLWEDIKDAFGFSSESDRATYEEATRRGGALLTAQVPDDRVDLAADIIDRHHPVDIDRRAEEWRQTGWTGYMPAGEVERPEPAGEQRTEQRAAGEQAEQAEQAEQREAVPVIQEQLKVGKQPIKRGGVRIHKHVTEQPVEEEVRLRDEDVHVERRKVDRPVTDRDQAFQDRTIEMTETDEEAVVSKEARVVEEVELSKDVHERREPVRDTVRREDVEVEDIDEGARGRQQMPGRDAASDFRADFDRNYAAGGASYEEYRPAYEFGQGLASNAAYRGRSFDEIEADARQRYEQAYPGRWDAHHGAIRTGFDRSRQA